MAEKPLPNCPDCDSPQIRIDDTWIACPVLGCWQEVLIETLNLEETIEKNKLKVHKMLDELAGIIQDCYFENDEQPSEDFQKAYVDSIKGLCQIINCLQEVVE